MKMHTAIVAVTALVMASTASALPSGTYTIIDGLQANEKDVGHGAGTQGWIGGMFAQTGEQNWWYYSSTDNIYWWDSAGNGDNGASFNPFAQSTSWVAMGHAFNSEGNHSWWPGWDRQTATGSVVNDGHVLWAAANGVRYDPDNNNGAGPATGAQLGHWNGGKQAMIQWVATEAGTADVDVDIICGSTTEAHLGVYDVSAGSWTQLDWTLDDGNLSATGVAMDTGDYITLNGWHNGVTATHNIAYAYGGVEWTADSGSSSGAIPEPASAALLLIGSVAVAMRRRKK